MVETEDAQKFAEQMDIKLYETSAKENINVEEVSQYSSPTLVSTIYPQSNQGSARTEPSVSGAPI